ncbi:MAG: hemerythrin domain-containing protein [Myxococcota bacterium]
MEALRNVEQVAAHLAVQVVVTVVQFHHPRARALQRRITPLVDELGLRARGEWRGPLSAFDTFSRELTAHMREEEAVLFDRVQFLMVRGQLTFGALGDARADFEALMEEHERMGALRRRLARELDATVSRAAELAPVRAALREFVTAFVEHHDFEARALVPTLRPFLVEP